MKSIGVLVFNYRENVLRFCTMSMVLLLSSCGGDNVRVDETLTVEVNGNSPVELLEGQKGTIDLNSNLTMGYNVEWSQLSGPDVFIEKSVNDSMLFIAPNVTRDELVEFAIKIITESNTTKSLKWQVKINNRAIVQQSSTPKPNIFSSSNIQKHASRPKDSTGVPLYLKDGNEYYYPVNIAQYAYDLYRNYLKTQDENILELFLINAQWLKDNCEYTTFGFCSYRAYFDIPAYKLTTDWTTAMGQGQAISSLIAAHYLTGDDRYAEVAFDALSAFQYPISQKGLTADFEGHIWYEEYGSDEMPAHVLNGFMFSLSGIYDYWQVFDEPLAKSLFDQGIDSLAANVELFDFNFTSRYDYSPLNQLASTKGGPDIYHELHIFQLGWLYSVSGVNQLKDIAHRFLKQDMGGIKSMSEHLYDVSKEIEHVSTSHSIDPVGYGPDKLVDANWTWLRYWSTHRFPADINLTLNEDINDAGILEKLIMTSTKEADFPDVFSIYEKRVDGELVLLRSDISLTDDNYIDYEHETGGYKSYTATIELNLPVTTNEIVIRVYGTDSGVLKLRELDVHYPRDKLLDEAMSFLK